MRPLVIIVSGAPCTGKTTLGRQIAAQLCLPFIHKDGIKETLFDSLGWKDRAWAQKLGSASYKLLYYFIKIQLQAGQSLVVESNFEPQVDSQLFLELQQEYPFRAIQIWCKTDSQILFQRFKARALSGRRHPGHVEDLTYQNFQPDRLQSKHRALNIAGRVIQVDTTHFHQINYERLCHDIQSFHRREGQ